MSIRNKLRQWLGITTLEADVSKGFDTVKQATAAVDTKFEAHMDKFHDTPSVGTVTEVKGLAPEYAPDQDGNVVTVEPKILSVLKDK